MSADQTFVPPSKEDPGVELVRNGAKRLWTMPPCKGCEFHLTGYQTLEVAKQMAEAYKGINGYIPQNMSITLLSENFLAGLKSIMKPDLPAAVPAAH